MGKTQNTFGIFFKDNRYLYYYVNRIYYNVQHVKITDKNTTMKELIKRILKRKTNQTQNMKNEG